MIPTDEIFGHECKDILPNDFLFLSTKRDGGRTRPPTVKSHSTIYYTNFAIQHYRSFTIALILLPDTAMKCNLSSAGGGG